MYKYLDYNKFVWFNNNNIDFYLKIDFKVLGFICVMSIYNNNARKLRKTKWSLGREKVKIYRVVRCSRRRIKYTHVKYGIEMLFKFLNRFW